jgi:outer membrane biosynthesis protein TonB
MNYQTNKKDKRNGLLTSMVVHTCIIVLLLMPFLTIPIPPPGQEGILVNLGLPDVGQGEENAAASAEEVAPSPEPEPQPEPTPTPPRKETPVKKEKATPTEEKLVKTEDPDAIALREKAKKEEEQRRQAEEQRKKEEADRIAREQEAAKKKAEADKLKNDIGGLFGPGKGKGNTGKPGNQGDPGGDPNATNLEGISTGQGSIGGGLTGRDVRARPKITDNSQREGTVVIEVCVDKSGSVVEARFIQKGSTLNDSDLTSMARQNAMQWKFEEGSVDRQCGTITYRFKLQ